MSAYIVDNKTINRIVNLLVHEVRNYPFSDNLKEVLAKLGFDLTTDVSAEKLANDMFTLNVSAVRQRYSEVGPIPPFAYVKSSLESFMQTFKSLRCWLYQCCEGDVPKSSLYQVFDGYVEKYLLKRVVYNLPEYHRAEWA